MKELKERIRNHKDKNDMLKDSLEAKRLKKRIYKSELRKLGEDMFQVERNEFIPATGRWP